MLCCSLCHGLGDLYASVFWYFYFFLFLEGLYSSHYPFIIRVLTGNRYFAQIRIIWVGFICKEVSCKRCGCGKGVEEPGTGNSRVVTSPRPEEIRGRRGSGTHMRQLGRTDSLRWVMNFSWRAPGAQGDLIGRNQEDKYSDLTLLPPLSLLLGLSIGKTQLLACWWVLCRLAFWGREQGGEKLKDLEWTWNLTGVLLNVGFDFLGFCLQYLTVLTLYSLLPMLSTVKSVSLFLTAISFRPIYFGWFFDTSVWMCWNSSCPNQSSLVICPPKLAIPQYSQPWWYHYPSNYTCFLFRYMHFDFLIFFQDTHTNTVSLGSLL